MAIECVCEKCAAQYRVDDRFAGKKVRCKKCSATILVEDPNNDEINLDDIAALATESMSGQSAAGRSAAGKSNAGKSVSGSLAGKSVAGQHKAPPTPPPSRIQQPSVIFEREDDLVSAPVTRAPRQPIQGIETPIISDQAAGLFSTILLLAYLGLMAYGAFKGYGVLQEKVENAGTRVMIGTGIAVAGFFVLSVPAFVIATIVGSKLDRKNSPPLDLIRAAGVAAVPYVVLLTAVLFLFSSDGVAADFRAGGLLALVLMFVLTAVATRELMQLRLIPAIVTFVVFLVLGTGAMIGTGVIQREALASYDSKSDKDKPTNTNNNTTITKAPPPPTNTPPPAQDPYKLALGDVMPRIDARIAQTKNFTREQLESYWKLQFEHFEKVAPREDSALYVQYAERITLIKQMIADAPSNEPPAHIFAPVADASPLTNSPSDISMLADPVKVGPVAIQPLKVAKLDLSKYDKRATSASWTMPGMPGARLTLTLIPRRDEKQTRPWVTDNKTVITIADARGLYTLDYTNPMETFVKLGDLTMTRLSPNMTAQPGAERRIYAGVQDGQFVELSITNERPEDRTALDLFEAMARSLRSAGETTADPFAIEAVVARLEDDFNGAAPIIEATGTSAEDALLAWAGASGKQPSPQVDALLRKVGTRKTAAFLAKFTGVAAEVPNNGMNPGGVATPLKPFEKPIIPAATVLEKFELEVDPAKKIEMLDSLARQTPDSNRDELAKLLEGILLTPGNDQLLPTTGKALAVWYGPKTVDVLLPMVEKGVPRAYRTAAITALAGTKSPKCVMPIMLCIQDEPETTVAALIAIGPSAEPDVIKLLRENDPNIRRNGARVLKEIGTSKCVVALKMWTDKGDRTFDDALAAVAARRRAGGN